MQTYSVAIDLTGSLFHRLCREFGLPDMSMSPRALEGWETESVAGRFASQGMSCTPYWVIVVFMVHGWLAALLEKCRRIISETKASRLTQNHYLKAHVWRHIPDRHSSLTRKEIIRVLLRFTSLPLDLILIWTNIQTRGHGTYHGSVQYLCRYLDVPITVMQYNHSTQTRLRLHAFERHSPHAPLL